MTGTIGNTVILIHLLFSSIFADVQINETVKKSYQNDVYSTNYNFPTASHKNKKSVFLRNEFELNNQSIESTRKIVARGSSNAVENLPVHISAEYTNVSDAEYNNISDNASIIESPYSTPVSWVLCILTGCISFITISGNILVIVSFFIERTLRTATNYFIASLALTDILIGIFSMNFYTAYLVMNRWPLGKLVCNLWLSLDYTACLTSQYTVCFITIDRFFSVRVPAKYRNWRTDGKVIFMVSIAWVIPAGVFFCIILGWPYFSPSLTKPEGTCYAEFAKDPIFNTAFTICYFWITLCVMIGLYMGIYKAALDLQRRNDEKRNRVKGLLSHMSANKTNIESEKVMRKMSQHHLQKVRTNIHSSSSMAGYGDSSEMESDELRQHRQPNNNNNKKVQLIQKPNLQAIKSNGADLAQQKPAAKSIMDSNRNDDKEADKTYTNFAAPIVKDNYIVNTQIPFRKNSNCPVHSIKNNNRSTMQTKKSEGTNPQNTFTTIQVDSPLLLEEEYDFELDHVDCQSISKQTLPSSPALCICSDVDDDDNDDNALIMTAGSPPTVDVDKCSENITDISKSNSIKEFEYQQKVLANYNRLIAAKRCTDNKITDSDYASMSNQSSHVQTTERSTSNNNNTKKMNTEKCGQLKTEPDEDTSELSYAKGNNLNTNSPIWKRQLSRNNSKLVDSMQVLDDWELQQHCLICAGEIDFRSPHTSCTDSDYLDSYATDLCSCNKDKQPKSCWHFLPTCNRCNPNLDATVFKAVPSIIGRSISNRWHRLRAKKEPTERGRRENRARKAFRTITFILGAFALCWIPYHIVIIVKGICDKPNYSCVNDILYSVTYWLCYMNSPINPFCYALANAQFKKTFLRIFHGDFRIT